MLVNSSTQLENEIEKATVKASVHAIVIPVIIFTIMFFIEKQYSVVFAVAYWTLPASIYITSRKHDISKKIFFRLIGVIFALVAVFGILVLTSV